MLFSDTEDLEDKIIRMVLREPLSLKSLHARLLSEGSLSLRAVYKATDKLLDAKTLVKVGRRVVVDEEWLRRVRQNLRSAPFQMPSPGERIIYNFVSIAHLDTFWKTIVLPLEEALAPKELFFYNPHNFWSYIPERAESEEAYYEHFKTEKRHGFLVLGGNSEGDKESKHQYQSEYLQIDTRDIGSLRRTEHFTLINSLILSQRLPKRTAAQIDELYASNRPIKDMLPELLAVCRAPGKIRFTLENNPAKAKKLRKLLARNFYFPRL